MVLKLCAPQTREEQGIASCIIERTTSLYPFPVVACISTSGLQYNGVPHTVFIIVLVPPSFASPKSVSFKIGCLLEVVTLFFNNTFSGFRSLNIQYNIRILSRTMVVKGELLKKNDFHYQHQCDQLQ